MPSGSFLSPISAISLETVAWVQVKPAFWSSCTRARCVPMDLLRTISRTASCLLLRLFTMMPPTLACILHFAYELCSVDNNFRNHHTSLMRRKYRNILNVLNGRYDSTNRRSQKRCCICMQGSLS